MKFFVAMFAGLAATLTAAPAWSRHFDVVAATGRSTPLGSGVQYSHFSTPSIDSSGRVTFLGTLAGTQVSPDNDAAIWQGQPQALQLVMREGDQVPGAAGVYVDPSHVFANDAGQLLVRTVLRGAGVTASNDTSFFAGSASSIVPIAREGSPIPGGDGTVVYDQLSTATIGSSGQVLFPVGLRGSTLTSSNDSAFFYSSAGATQILAREGSPAPAAGQNPVYGDFHDLVDYAKFNSLGMTGGDVTFAAVVRTGPNRFNITETRSLLGGPPTAIHTIDYAGDPADRWQAGTIGGIAGNQAGKLSFTAVLDTGSASDYHIGLWAGTPGSIHSIAMTDTVDPRLPPDTKWSNFGQQFVNAQGDVSYWGTTIKFGVTSGALYKQSATGLSQIMRSNGQAPDTTAGTVFSPTFGDYIMNPIGQIALDWTLSGPDVTSANNKGLWATDSSGLLHLIARTGETIDLGDGISRQLSDILLPTQTGTYGPVNNFNAQGQLVFTVAFTDGTQAILLATVPEPGTAVLAGIAAMLCIWLAVRRQHFA